MKGAIKSQHFTKTAKQNHLARGTQMQRMKHLVMQTIEAKDNIAIKHPFLDNLSPEFQEFLEKCGSLRKFDSGKEIFHEGNQAERFFLILSGSVILETFVPGCGTVTIQRLGSGQALGWSWLFDPYQWHFSATTDAPTELIEFDAAKLRKKANQNPRFANELLTRVARILLERLQFTRGQLIDFYGMRP
jgi:CRP-like cAMP-binding protein